MTASTNDGLCGNKGMIGDDTVMAEVATAPDHDIVPDFAVWLDHGARQNKAVLADVFRIDDAARVDEGGKSVAASLSFQIAIASKFVHTLVAKWTQELHLRRRKDFFKVLPGD